GQQLREVSHDAPAGMRMLFADAFEIVEGYFERACRNIGEHVGRARRLDQGHLAERHAGGQCREANAVSQGDVNSAAAQEVDGGIEQIEVADVLQAARPLPDDVPLPRATLHPGEDHRDIVRGKLAEFFRYQPRTGARQRGDAVQVEDDELRTWF